MARKGENKTSAAPKAAEAAVQEAAEIKEEVKEKEAPAPKEEKKDGNGKVLILSQQRKGKSVFAVTGEPVTFDKDGKAYVSAEDAEYLAKVPGIERG